MKKILLSALLAAAVSVSSLEAFDEKREGFILSVGAGVSAVTTDITVSSGDYSASADETSLGLATSLKIGYGFTNQFSVYYVRNASWFGYDNDSADDWYASGIVGVGASYYIEENSPMYVMAAVGMGDYANASENEGETGSAFMLGGGYEVYPHVQVEATYLVANVEEDNVELGTGAFQLTVNYQWY